MVMEVHHPLQQFCRVAELLVYESTSLLEISLNGILLKSTVVIRLLRQSGACTMELNPITGEDISGFL